MRRFLESLEYYYDQLMTTDFEPIMARWRHLADMQGRKVTVQARGDCYSGEVVDFDRDGFMILRGADGREKRILSGDVTFI